MTADEPTHADSDNSVHTRTDDILGNDPDAQYIIKFLQQHDGRATRQQLLFDGQLPEDVLDLYLDALDGADVLTRQEGYSGTQIQLTNPTPEEADT